MAWNRISPCFLDARVCGDGIGPRYSTPSRGGGETTMRRGPERPAKKGTARIGSLPSRATKGRISMPLARDNALSQPAR